VRRAIGFVEGVDDELALDADRVFGLFAEEDDAAAETALRLLALLVERRVDPGGDEARRDFRVGLVVLAPEL
jgi:hypothetical protein